MGIRLTRFLLSKSWCQSSFTTVLEKGIDRTAAIKTPSCENDLLSDGNYEEIFCTASWTWFRKSPLLQLAHQ